MARPRTGLEPDASVGTWTLSTDSTCPSPGLIVVNITATDEATAMAAMRDLDQLWTTSGIRSVRREPREPGVRARIYGPPPAPRVRDVAHRRHCHLPTATAATRWPRPLWREQGARRADQSTTGPEDAVADDLRHPAVLSQLASAPLSDPSAFSATSDQWPRHRCTAGATRSIVFGSGAPSVR